MEREKKKKREIEAMDVMLLCNNYELVMDACIIWVMASSSLPC
jgi:hypothetical protein